MDGSVGIDEGKGIHEGGGMVGGIRV